MFSSVFTMIAMRNWSKVTKLLSHSTLRKNGSRQLRYKSPIFSIVEHMIIQARSHLCSAVFGRVYLEAVLRASPLNAPSARHLKIAIVNTVPQASPDLAAQTQEVITTVRNATIDATSNLATASRGRIHAIRISVMLSQATKS